MKKALALILALVMMLSLVACGGKDTGKDNVDPADRVLHMRTNSALQSTDWQTTTLTCDMQILWVQVFEGLYGMDEANGGYYKLLAKDVAVDDTSTIYTITLQDATFQNGNKLTAEDVVFSYGKAMENSRFNYLTSMIDKVEAKDEKTVVITLKYAYSAIDHTFWSLKIYNKAEYEQIVAKGETFGTKPHTAATGPYVLTAYDANGVTLKAYDAYWGGAPDIKNVEYRVISEDAAAVIAFENGELDYFTSVPASDWENVKKAAGDNCNMSKGNDITWVAVNNLSNVNNNILANEKVREAIAYAIDKNACVQAATAGYGTPAYEYMPSEYVSTSPNYKDGNFATFDLDIEKAKQCLRDAGYTDADMAAGIDIGEIVTYGAATGVLGKVAVVLQANLAAIGLKAQVVVQEYAIIGDRLYGQQYDLAIFGDSGNFDFNNIRQQVHSESVGMYLVDFAAKNAFAVANNKTTPFDWQKMEELVDKGVGTAVKEERYKIYTELWKMVMDTKTILPVLHKGVGIAWSSNITVPGLCPSYYHIDQWSWAA